MTTTGPRWTDETEAAVARAAYVEWTGGERDGLPTGDHLLAALARDRWGHIARSVLTALAAKGLLVEPGGETRKEWASHGGALQWGADEGQARREAAEGKGPLVRRTVYTGPWRAAQ